MHDEVLCSVTKDMFAHTMDKYYRKKGRQTGQMNTEVIICNNFNIIHDNL